MLYMVSLHMQCCSEVKRVAMPHSPGTKCAITVNKTGGHKIVFEHIAFTKCLHHDLIACASKMRRYGHEVSQCRDPKYAINWPTDLLCPNIAERVSYCVDDRDDTCAVITPITWCAYVLTAAMNADVLQVNWNGCGRFWSRSVGFSLQLSWSL